MSDTLTLTCPHCGSVIHVTVERSARYGPREYKDYYRGKAVEDLSTEELREAQKELGGFMARWSPWYVSAHDVLGKARIDELLRDADARALNDGDWDECEEGEQP